jgi:hypothetical protein
VVGHDNDYLIFMPESGDDLGDMTAGTTILHDRDLVSDTFGITCNIYALDGDEGFRTGGNGNTLVMRGRIRRMLAMPGSVVPFGMVAQVDGFVYGREGTRT